MATQQHRRAHAKRIANRNDVGTGHPGEAGVAVVATTVMRAVVIVTMAAAAVDERVTDVTAATVRWIHGILPWILVPTGAANIRIDIVLLAGSTIGPHLAATTNTIANRKGRTSGERVVIRPRRSAAKNGKRNATAVRPPKMPLDLRLAHHTNRKHIGGRFLSGRSATEKDDLAMRSVFYSASSGPHEPLSQEGVFRTLVLLGQFVLCSAGSSSS